MNPTSRTGKLALGGLHLLEGAAAFGLVSGAAIVAAFGKFLLGGVLAVLALGVFARMGRRARAKAAASRDLGTP